MITENLQNNVICKKKKDYKTVNKSKSSASFFFLSFESKIRKQ